MDIGPLKMKQEMTLQKERHLITLKKTFSSNGVFDGIDAGVFSEDGSSFNLTNSTPGCPGDVTYIHGIRN